MKQLMVLKHTNTNTHTGTGIIDKDIKTTIVIMFKILKKFIGRNIC